MMTSSQTTDNSKADQPVPDLPHSVPTGVPIHPELEAYWVERKRYLQKISTIPELRRRYVKAGLIYLLRRLLWSFGFFPLVLAFWIPLVVARFNPVAMIQDLLPHMEAFVAASPQIQATTLETVIIAWLSIGFIFAVFDFVLTPFKSPYEYEADVHMRAWEQVQVRGEPPTERAGPASPLPLPTEARTSS